MIYIFIAVIVFNLYCFLNPDKDFERVYNKTTKDTKWNK